MYNLRATLRPEAAETGSIGVGGGQGWEWGKELPDIRGHNGEQMSLERMRECCASGIANSGVGVQSVLGTTLKRMLKGCQTCCSLVSRKARIVTEDQWPREPVALIATRTNAHLHMHPHQHASVILLLAVKAATQT